MAAQPLCLAVTFAAPGPNSAGLLDSVLACAAQPCSKSGYKFAVATAIGLPADAYTLTAVPITLGQTGVRGFCSDQLAHMTYDPSGASACTSLLQ